MIPVINHDSSEGEQWRRYNLPRILYCQQEIITIWLFNMALENCPHMEGLWWLTYEKCDFLCNIKMDYNLQ